jgi:NAD-dependent dihydropyrimidine dehydrogenase PreA subunit
MVLRIDESKCTGCGICTGVCPAEALTVADGKVVVSDNCIECGLCVAECSQGALSLDTL